MKSRFVGTLAVALTSLGIFAGTAGAFSGNSSHTINSYFSTTGGSCFAATQTPGYHGNSAPMQYWPYNFPGVLFCGSPG